MVETHTVQVEVVAPSGDETAAEEARLLTRDLRKYLADLPDVHGDVDVVFAPRPGRMGGALLEFAIAAGAGIATQAASGAAARIGAFLRERRRARHGTAAPRLSVELTVRDTTSGAVLGTLSMPADGSGPEPSVPGDGTDGDAPAAAS